MPTRRSYCRAPLVALIATLLLPALAGAQYFGRNKVQWESFDFHVVRTEHFDVYHYPPDNRAAEDAARMAERWYARLSSVFRHQFTERKPIVLYANHADFHQTTITGGLIGEGTGGFTEPLQNRLVMPLTGSYADTDHVMGHEMVHVFQFDIAGTLSSTRQGQGSRLNQLPLWMVEGLAEYLTIGRADPHTAMWLRDAMMRDDLPTLRQLSRDPRFFPYRWGQAFWAYVGGRWGDPTVVTLFIASMQVGIQGAIESVLGLSDEQLSKDWHAAIRAAYPAELTARRTAGAERVLGGKEARDLNLAPVVSPDGEQLAFLSSRDLFSISLFLADADGRVRERLASSESDPHFDALRFIDSAGAWTPDGREFALIVYARGDNRLAIVDAERGRVRRTVKVPGVSEISSIDFSPDGRTIVVAGSTNGVSDLHLLDLESGAVRNLTGDLHADLQPAFSPDGRTIVFVSDRGEETDFSQLSYAPMRLALLDLASGTVRTLRVFERAKHINPQFSPDGQSLFFISDPDGISNVYRIALDTGEVARVTDVPTGVTGITDMSPALSVASGTGRLMYSVYERNGYAIYSLSPEQTRGEPVGSERITAATAGTLPPAEPRGETFVSDYLEEPRPGLPEASDFEVRGYKPRLGLDFIGPPTIGVGVSSSGYGLGGGLSAYFSDILGEHQLGVSLQGGSSSQFGTDIGAQATYLNRAHRLNWGVAATHVPFISAATYGYRETVTVGDREVLADVFEQIRERVTVDEAGLIGLYPLSLTKRFELNGTWTRLSYDREIERVIVVGNAVLDRQEVSLPAPEALSYGQASVAYVGDTSYFGFTSPLRGTRYRLEVGQSFGEFEFQTVLADLRTYAFANPFSFGVRGLHFGRYGSGTDHPRLSPLYLGRDTLVRGYAVGDFDISECSTVSDDPNACPEFDRLVGSRLAVVNLEARVQVLGTEALGLANFPYLPLELSAFVDAGTAWTDEQRPELRYDRTTPDRVPVVSAGLAARMLIGGYIPLQIYVAKPFHRPREDRVWGVIIAPGW